MESLAEVMAILRYEGRQDLAALLTDAEVDLEFLDVGFPLASDGEIFFTNANIYAPITACKSLRELPKDDDDAILDALREVWAVTEAGGTYVKSVSYSIDRESLGERFALLYADPIGWSRVDRTMDRIRGLLTTAATEEQFNEVGLLCREGLISLAEAVFEPSKHPPLPNDNTDVSRTDVKRMVGRYVASEYPGSSNREFRKCVDSTVDLANKVTHRRTSTHRDAVLCAQATINLIGLIAVISGKRDRDQQGPSAESHVQRFEDIA